MYKKIKFSCMMYRQSDHMFNFIALIDFFHLHKSATYSGLNDTDIFANFINFTILHIAHSK